LRQVGAILQAKALTGEHLLDRLVVRADATDLMSQVLAFSAPGTVLLTSLTNVQVVNTADLANLVGVVFVRGLRPTLMVLNQAEEAAVPMLVTRHSMYEACGLLYQEGLPGLSG